MSFFFIAPPSLRKMYSLTICTHVLIMQLKKKTHKYCMYLEGTGMYGT